MNGPVQPPCANPPSVSSPACPGACTTPSSDTYSTTMSFLIEPPLTPLFRSATNIEEALDDRQGRTTGRSPAVSPRGSGSLGVGDRIGRSDGARRHAL